MTVIVLEYVAHQMSAQGLAARVRNFVGPPTRKLHTGSYINLVDRPDMPAPHAKGTVTPAHDPSHIAWSNQ